MKDSKSEVRLSGIDIFYCNYCGERIDKTEPCVIIQKNTVVTELRHKECENL